MGESAAVGAGREECSVIRGSREHDPDGDHGRLTRALWLGAPLALRRHPVVAVAVVVTAALATAAAAAAPLVRASVQSESLRQQVASMSPLAAGFEIDRVAGPPGLDRARRAGAVAFARSQRFSTAPVATSMFPATVANANGSGLQVVPMARTGAAAHVQLLAGGRAGGVLISSVVAKVTHLRPGGTLQLGERGLFPGGPPPVLRFRVAGIYRSLDGDLGNPYWANFVQDIRPVDPNLPPLPTFVLMPEPDLVRAAERLRATVLNRFEFPLAASRLTFVGANQLSRRYAELDRRLPALARGLGCTRACAGHSSLSSALAIAAADVAAVSPTISLLSDAALLVALALSLAAGVFLVRRRVDEVQLLFSRGESTASFSVRSAVEAVAPAALGALAGVAAVLSLVRALAPAGSVDAATVRAATAAAAVAALVAVAAVGAGAAIAFPRVAARRWLPSRRLPWEPVPIAAAAALTAVVLSGGGLAHDANGDAHPRLVVFLLPLLFAAGAGGIAVRALRRAARAGGSASPTVFLAVRRLAAARALLAAVVVAATTSFATFAYAATLASSAERAAAEKAFVANGSDVQGLVDAYVRVTSPFPFPVAIVQTDSLDTFLPSGAPVDTVVGDPRALARTIEWGAGWPGDPRRELPRLAGPAPALPLRAIGTPNMPDVGWVYHQGARVPVRVVARTTFPGVSTRPALLIAAGDYRRATARLGLADPPPSAFGLVWAKGDPRSVQPALARSNLGAVYLTTLDHLRLAPGVVASERSYRYLRVVGAAAAALSLIALLLYLGARQRGQLIATALLRRMGLAAAADAAALALEAAVIVALACAVGAAVAVAAADPLVGRVDALPQYAPAPQLVVPWWTLAAGAAAAVVVAAGLAAAAAQLAARADVSKALRVA